MELVTPPLLNVMNEPPFFSGRRFDDTSFVDGGFIVFFCWFFFSRRVRGQHKNGAQCPGRCHDNDVSLTGDSEMKSSLGRASLPGVTRDRISTGRGHRCDMADYRSIGPEGGKNVPLRPSI